MSIHVPVRLLPNSKLTLAEKDCVLKNDGTNYVLRFRYDECGSSLSFFKSYILIKNVITVHKDLNLPIVLDSDFTLPIECKMNRSAIVEGGFQAVTRDPITEVEDDDDRDKYLHYILREFKTEDYKREITDFPVKIPINREIFLELSANASSSGSTIMVKKCYATPSPNPRDRTVFGLITNGCPDNKAVHLIPSSNSTHRRFKVQTFHFGGNQNDHNKVYIHCQVRFCTPNPCREPTCSRSKRSARTMFRRNRFRFTRESSRRGRGTAVSLGPFLLV